MTVILAGALFTGAGGGAPVIVTLFDVSDAAESVAVMLVVPSASAITKPVALTEAITGLLECQPSGAVPDMAVLVPSSTTAVNCSRWPTRSVALVGVTEILVGTPTGAGGGLGSPVGGCVIGGVLCGPWILGGFTGEPCNVIRTDIYGAGVSTVAPTFNASIAA